jgi:hypothetical protein
MRLECTEIFVHYREIARLVWNLGFLPNPKLREWDCVKHYDEAMARLFEGIVLLALGYEGHVEDKNSPGEVANFQVERKHDIDLRVDANRPEEPGHIWGDPVVHLRSESAPVRLRFVRFFDWDLLGSRDFRLLEVLIEQLDDRPELVGRHALVELHGCSVWLVEDNVGKQ